MRIFVTILLLLVVVVSSAQIQERQVKATEVLETGVTFKYRGNTIPVNDITYHEFSSDSITWRKDYQSGDCYARFSNDLKTTWWGLNFCTWNGATLGSGGTLDTLYVYYYSSDTITMIDTIVVDENINIKIPQPETLTGSTTNYQDTSQHTHEVVLHMGEIENVDTVGIADSKILKYNATSEKWEIANDLTGGGGTSLTVAEQDGSPSVTNVSTIKVENGSVTNNGGGIVSIDFLQEAVDLPQDFYRAGEFTASAGDNFVTFTDAFTDNDYTLVQAYALYTDSTRQNLVYDSLAANGFRVLDVIGSSNIHYLAMRDLDSLGLAVENQGKVLGSGADLTMSYLNGAVDDSTITVVSDDLHVLYTDIDSLSLDTTYTPTGTEVKGTFYWDEGTQTFVTVLGDIMLNNGKEVHVYGKNVSGALIPNGWGVSVTSSPGDFTSFELTDASDATSASSFIGVATQDIAAGEFGHVTKIGLVNDINTTELTEGGVIYISTTVNGKLTDTIPEAPYFTINAGICERSHATVGRINVIPYVIPKMDQLSDVDGTPLTTTGQFYVWNQDSTFFDATYNVDTFKLVDMFYAEMYEYENAVLTTIGTQDVYHAVNDFSAGSLNGFSFTGGIEGSIASVADYSGTVAGTVLITDVAHGLLTGDIITIHVTTDYNGTYSITKVTDDTFYVTATYTSSQTGEWAMGSYLECLAGSDGVYHISMSNTSFSAAANTRFKFELNKNTTMLDNIAASRTYATTDYGSISSQGLVSLVEGDRIWLSVVNQTSTTDITIRHANVTIIRL